VQYPAHTMKILAAALLVALPIAAQQPTVLHAARILDVAAGKTLSPGEVLITGNKITEAGTHVSHPAGAQVIDLGDTTLMPGLIDAHVHLFLHPGAEDLQTVEESVPQRTLTAAAQAKADVMAGFTAERDMGTEGAHCADVAVRNAIDSGLIPGPRMRVSCNAIDILGGRDRIQSGPARPLQRRLREQRRRDHHRNARTTQRRRGLHQDLRNRPGPSGGRNLHNSVSIH
jgi:imidazolonepropionase-like amidohydrolase